MRWVMSDAFAAGDQLNPSAWVDSYRSLVDVERGELTVGDLEVLAVAAHLIGDDDVSADAWERAVNRHLDAGDRAEAARCSFWSALMLMLKGRTAHASGRLGRAEQMMGEDVQGVASGYLLTPSCWARWRPATPTARCTSRHGRVPSGLCPSATRLAVFDPANLAVVSAANPGLAQACCSCGVHRRPVRPGRTTRIGPERLTLGADFHTVSGNSTPGREAG